MRGLLVLDGERDIDLPSASLYDVVVVCDGAFEGAKEALEKIDLVIGDFDSLGYVPTDVPTLTYEEEKDETDGELGLDYLIEREVDEIEIYWALGKSLDHMLGNLGLLKRAMDMGVIASIIGKNEELYLTDSGFTLEDVLGKRLSLLPFSNSVHILLSKGLKYPPDNLILTKDKTVGLSNVAIENEVEIECEGGELLLIINR